MKRERERGRGRGRGREGEREGEGSLGLQPPSCFTNSLDLFQAILGKVVKRPSYLDKELVEDLMSCAQDDDGFKTVRGKTMCTLDFYEGNRCLIKQNSELILPAML